ncbi:UDP-N-acetylmuramate dehydrogenase [soil metagenome]
MTRPLSELTSMRVGGDALELIEPTDVSALIEAARAVWAGGDEWLVLGGGSNVVVSDEGFDGTVIRVATSGIEELGDGRLRVAAGENWDALVAFTVERGLAGIEALSGIPGSVGAAPVQNIGAYGQELSDVLVSVDFLDAESGDFERMPAADLALGYRTSAIKQGRAGIVVAVELALNAGESTTVRYAQLAAALGVAVGESAAVADVRSAVLGLRASKGMVLDDSDPDSVSCGSFFTNPIVSREFAVGLPADAPRFAMSPETADVAVALGEEPAAPPVLADARVKLSAAWLIERAGIAKGFRLPGSRAAISSKHTLAITNTGGATAAQVVELARFVQLRVFAEFGVQLAPEPNLVGVFL